MGEEMELPLYDKLTMLMVIFRESQCLIVINLWCLFAF